MPCFHLHIRDGFEVLDEEGQEFASLGDARQAAVASARDMMAADIRVGRLSLGDRIDITDSGGTLLETVRFADAVEVER